MISDVARLSEKLLETAVFNGEKLLHFDQSEPIKPLQQLLAVQPSGSKNLLPKQLGNLMIDSKINIYYPDDFEEDYDNVKYR